MKTGNKKKKQNELSKKTELVAQYSKYLVARSKNIFFSFITVFVTPYTVILATIILYLFFKVQGISGDSRLLIEIVITLLTGVFGGIVQDSIVKMSEESYVTRRSSGAVRNLLLIKEKVINTRMRIKKLTKHNNNRDFEEIENLIDNIQKDILNSISDWGDVNPRAALITNNYQFQNALVSQEELRVRLEEKLDEAKKAKSKNIDTLKQQILESEKSISLLKQKISNSNYSLSPSNSKLGSDISSLIYLSEPSSGPSRTITGGPIQLDRSGFEGGLNLGNQYINFDKSE